MKIGSSCFDIGLRTYIMGILNITPDSFSDGGMFYNLDAAVVRGLDMELEGADIIDVGGESTRPGHTSVDPETEISRVVPVIRSLSEKLHIPISIDTSKADVAEAALKAGASMVNDVWGLQSDPHMRGVVAKYDAACCIMHNKKEPEYGDLMHEIIEELKKLTARAIKAGISSDKIITDPGIGFGKTVDQNIRIMQNLGRMNELNYPWLLGTSRKSMIGKSLKLPVGERLEPTLASNVIGMNAGADFIRVHDVLPHVRACRMTDMFVRPPHRGTSSVCISLGANMGDRKKYITDALGRIGSDPAMKIDRISRIYETSPVGNTDQNAFLNAAAVIETELKPEELLARFQAIEKSLGRVRAEKWGPRTIDIDILMYDGVQQDESSLILPHPRMTERLFVLLPLNEIASLRVHPGENLRIFELLRDGAFPDQRAEPYADVSPFPAS